MEMREGMDLFERTDTVNGLLARYGVKFGIYKDNTFQEQLFPFDAIPRVIGKDEFAYLEKGLEQRVTALNLFLRDIYNEKKILKDKVVPEEFIYASSGYLVECEGIVPPKGVYSHISGIDLVLGKDGIWYILEDNLRVPSGASYPMIARGLCRRSSPRTFQNISVADNRNYADLLKATLDHVNTGGLTVVLTPGRYNAAYFEHSYLAERMQVPLVTCHDLEVENDRLYFINYNGKKEPVGAVYRRISDEYIDPMTFNRDSIIGIPHMFDIYRKGKVALVNTPGNGVADDKGIYYFVPQMIRYYLGEEPILHNAPTYLPYYEEDMKYVLEHFDSLVLKDVAEAGGYGVVFGNRMSTEQKEAFIGLLKKEPRRFIAQEVIDFCDLPILEKGELVDRKADLRAFILTAERSVVWKSGLTRFSRNPDSFIVNSSQGGGFKDTWVLNQ
ncbi:circularly permuted type 2 ATP-grasp protein [Lacrimispora sp.]|uniref:circularly permuted type 2 ATP-grasp protein n=1 Tax=Lacrimispora sp. TaxID=2719234 RepID=UPI002FD9CA20